MLHQGEKSYTKTDEIVVPDLARLWVTAKRSVQVCCFCKVWVPSEVYSHYPLCCYQAVYLPHCSQSCQLGKVTLPARFRDILMGLGGWNVLGWHRSVWEGLSLSPWVRSWSRPKGDCKEGTREKKKMNVQDPLPTTKRETVTFHLHDHSMGFQRGKKQMS